MTALRKTIDFCFANSLFLLFGAGAALVWANIDYASYYGLVHLKFFATPYFGAAGDEGMRVFDFHYLVNDVLMALFFAIAGKEVWEALLPGGSLSSARRAATPLLAALGGMVGPAAVYLGGASLLGRFDDLGSGWAVPCATDIAFSYLVARAIFGASHPAVPFLLLLAIADDAMGLLILAVFYPQGELAPAWLSLALAAVGGGMLMRRAGVAHFAPDLIGPGAVSWAGFALAGLHPALGLLPVIPTLPHAHSRDWQGREDTLNAFEHALKKPVDLFLGLFGLLNAGVVFNAVGAPTALVLAGLLLGKPLGIWLFGMGAARVLNLGLPPGIRGGDLIVIGSAASIGFTVALFVATAAFAPGPLQEAAKMGALVSLGGALLAFGAARALGIKKAIEREASWQRAA